MNALLLIGGGVLTFVLSLVAVLAMRGSLARKQGRAEEQAKFQKHIAASERKRMERHGRALRTATLTSRDRVSLARKLREIRRRS